MTEKIIRCAIYTRKSTEEGLEKEFNSLEAQREACEAYIRSQKHEGWQLIPTAYDDGGYSGGNMERPGLKALMDDIRAGKIDVIAVYKVDRLSRSLSDFSQMVTVFDANNVSFVSITQQFNTTTSMGRLTLNILLSFAQFEREVIGERVRDKIEASKAKGMWMGGQPPLGYRINGRSLAPNPEEAALVTRIFERYVELQSGYKLAAELNRQGFHSKAWTTYKGVDRGGQPFTYQGLYKILSNPLYIGLIRHKTKTYPGQHEGIISLALWEQAQQALAANRGVKPRHYTKQSMLLTGKCFSPAGKLYSPVYTTRKKTLRYRYYWDKSATHRVKAPDLESLVFDTIRVLAARPAHWRPCLGNVGARLAPEEAQHRWEAVWALWPQMNQMQRLDLAERLIDRIVISGDSIVIRLTYAAIGNLVIESVDRGYDLKAEKLNPGLTPHVIAGSDYIEIGLEACFKKHGRIRMAFDYNGAPVKAIATKNHDPVLIAAIIRSFRWNRMLEEGSFTIFDIAKQSGYGRSYVSKTVSLMLLAPDIIAAILDGTQPATLQLKDLWAGCRPVGGSRNPS